MASISDIILKAIDKQTISKNKWLIMLIFASLGGGTGTVYQTLGIQQAKSDGNKMVHEVATELQKQIPITEIPKPTKVVKTNCSSCRSLWQKDINSYNTQHIKDSH